MVSTIDMKMNLSKMTNILNNDNDKKRQQTNKSITTKTKKVRTLIKDCIFCINIQIYVDVV